MLEIDAGDGMLLETEAAVCRSIGETGCTMFCGTQKERYCALFGHFEGFDGDKAVIRRMGELMENNNLPPPECPLKVKEKSAWASLCAWTITLEG